MKIPAIFTALLLSTAVSALAATPETAPIIHPIVGKWQWTRSANNCTETYDYRPDGTLLVVSGREEATSTYTIAPRQDANGFYELAGRPAKSNGSQDCSDSPPNRDTSPYTAYIMFHPTEPLHLVCQTPAVDRCFGPLRRVGP